jgi:hypothetical protein
MAGEDDRIQRALNEAKREELREKYGAEFRGGNHILPPEIESRWLHEIEEFERQFDRAPQVSVRRYVGDPPVRPLGEIPPDDLPGEMDRLLELLRCNNIEICFGRDLSDPEIYRFITEEIFAQKIADLRIDGLTLSFLYDEFHPDPAREASWAAEDFLRAIFERNDSVMLGLLPGENSPQQPDGPPPADRLRRIVFNFLGDMAAFFDWRADIIACTVEGDEASVRAGVSWKGLDAETLRTVSASGDAVLHLHMENGLWTITAADIPGVSSS